MQVSLDGGKTWTEVENVRVTYSDIDIPGEDQPGEVHFNFTDEGLITDIWCSREEENDHNLATASQTIDELVDEMVEENSD